MSEVRVEGLSKRFGAQAAVDDVAFTAEAGSFLVLLGPSGCGKSTTLRMIAGLEQPSEGRVVIDGQDVTGRDPAKRHLSMVFQSYALFPHLSVAENILFGLKVRRVPKAEQADRLSRTARLVGLDHLLDRRPAQLSGGQRQRVALARAIVAQHSVCLMDEPLSNLDAKLRHEMRVELRALQQRLGMTVLYVTHDQTEAMSMADKVVLLDGGRLVQQGAPEDLYLRPASAFAARFIGTPPMNLLPLRPIDGGHAALAHDPTGRAVLSGDGAGWHLGVRPEHLALSGDGPGLPVVVTSADYHGADTVVGVRLGDGPDGSDRLEGEVAATASDGPMAADREDEIMVRVAGRVRPRHGETLRLNWTDGDLHLFGPDGKRQDPRPRVLPLTA